jgi:uncharacterized protein YbgA (DUF1722 family)/uncharacterized protein YbbK (DUF523 family)
MCNYFNLERKTMSNLPNKLNGKPQIGVSACLAGLDVRFDGSHISNHFVNIDCSAFFEMHTMCPEVEMGLGIPRPAIQLRDFDDETRLVYSKTPEIQITHSMREFAERKIKTLTPLDGFIFKKGSPSCGVYKVPVVNNKTGMRRHNGIGLFAQAFKERYPQVPTEDEGRLNDKGIRENFLERVYAHYRWRQITESQNPLQPFRQFHKNYKLILMAKDNRAYRQLGRIVASINRHNYPEKSQAYFRLFMQAMTKIPTHGHHVNVMMHILGYLKDHLNGNDKVELLKWFETYREKRVNRVTPMMLLQHHFNRHPNDYIAEQYYFSPFPDELMLPV